MYFVITLKTDTVDKPHAIHITKLKAKYRQKGVFQTFLKNHAEHPKEYYVNSLQKKGKPRNFYSKQAALNTVRKLAEENGYHVRLPKNVWGVYKKLDKVRKKPRANKQYVVQRIPADELRDFVVKSIEEYCPIDQAVKIMFERKIPVFSMATRMDGMWDLFKNSGVARCDLLEETLTRFEHYNKKRGKCNHDRSGNCLRQLCNSDRLSGWDARFYQKKRTVNEMCARLTKMYSKTPGSRLHTVDAVRENNIKETPQLIVKVV